MTLDISKFYLMTPLKRPEYIRVKIDDIPEEIINEYKLQEIAKKQGMVYIEVTKGMCGLSQAGLLTNELLEQRLNKHGYFQSKLVPGLWKHTTRLISFTLVKIRRKRTCRTTKSKPIGWEPNTSGYTWHGIMKKVGSTYTCRDMCNKHSSSFNTYERRRKTNHSTTPQSNMEP
jgi:hypothetical protein